MYFNELYHFSFIEYSDFTVRDPNGREHCKTLPWYIFAQAYEGHYELDAGNGSAVCEEGGAFFTPPGIPLRIRHFANPETGNMRVRFIHFLAADKSGLDPLRHFLPHLSVTAAECRKPCEILEKIIRGQNDVFQQNAAIMNLFGILPHFMTPVRINRFSSELESVCIWIRQHAGESITAHNAAERYPYSRSKFFADFMSAYGISPGEYILRERIRFATTLMQTDKTLTVKEVSCQGGWKTPYHFSRCFRSVLGESPGSYKNINQTF